MLNKARTKRRNCLKRSKGGFCSAMNGFDGLPDEVFAYCISYVFAHMKILSIRCLLATSRHMRAVVLGHFFNYDKKSDALIYFELFLNKRLSLLFNDVPYFSVHANTQVLGIADWLLFSCGTPRHSFKVRCCYHLFPGYRSKEATQRGSVYRKIWGSGVYTPLFSDTLFQYVRFFDGHAQRDNLVQQVLCLMVNLASMTKNHSYRSLKVMDLLHLLIEFFEGLDDSRLTALEIFLSQYELCTVVLLSLYKDEHVCRAQLEDMINSLFQVQCLVGVDVQGADVQSYQGINFSCVRSAMHGGYDRLLKLRSSLCFISRISGWRRLSDESITSLLATVIYRSIQSSGSLNILQNLHQLGLLDHLLDVGASQKCPASATLDMALVLQVELHKKGVDSYELLQYFIGLAQGDSVQLESSLSYALSCLRNHTEGMLSGVDYLCCVAQKK